jgi:lysophospholipase L1-like esterase
MLRDEYAQQDGLHLSAAAYRAILQYMRTHGCP